MKGGGSLEGEVKEPVQKDLRPLDPEMCMGIEIARGNRGQENHRFKVTTRERTVGQSQQLQALEQGKK